MTAYQLFIWPETDVLQCVCLVCDTVYFPDALCSPAFQLPFAPPAIRDPRGLRPVWSPQPAPTLVNERFLSRPALQFHLSAEVAAFSNSAMPSAHMCHSHSASPASEQQVFGLQPYLLAPCSCCLPLPLLIRALPTTSLLARFPPANGHQRIERPCVPRPTHAHLAQQCVPPILVIFPAAPSECSLPCELHSSAARWGPKLFSIFFPPRVILGWLRFVCFAAVAACVKQRNSWAHLS